MKTIWKYQLDITYEQVIEIPCGARMLNADVQSSVLCVWVEVTPDERTERVRFLIRGTGHPYVPEEHEKYIDSVLLDGFVWHVYFVSLMIEEPAP